MTGQRRFRWMAKVVAVCCAALMLLSTNVVRATPTVTLIDWSVTSIGGSSTVQAYYFVSPNGTIEATPNPPEYYGGYTSYIGDWLTPATGMGNYEVRATHNCPNAPWRYGTSGTFNTWISADTWSGWWGVYIYEINQSVNCGIEVQIRAKANPSVILDTAYVSFNLWTGP
jgi:hypothetical protein